MPKFNLKSQLNTQISGSTIQLTRKRERPLNHTGSMISVNFNVQNQFDFFSRSEQGMKIIEEAEDHKEESDFITAFHMILITANINGKNYLQFCSYPCTPGDLNKFCMITPRPKSCPFRIWYMIQRRNKMLPSCVDGLVRTSTPG